jgi:hypothetical protein
LGTSRKPFGAYTNHMQEQLDRIEIKLAEIDGKLDVSYQSMEKVRTYLMWGFWITVAIIVLPIFILPLFLPAFMSSLVLPPGL